MPAQEPTPFSGRKRTRAERKHAERRSREIQAAFAAAMPPPDPGTRRDPLTGEPASSATNSDPAARQAAPSPFDPSRPAGSRPISPAAPVTPTWPSTATWPAGAPTQPGPAAADWRPDAVPAREPKPRRRARKASSSTGSPASLPSLAAVAQKQARPSLLRRVAGQWSGRTGRVALLVGAPASAVAAMVGAGVGLPVLGHPIAWPWLVAGGGAALVLGATATRGWSATSAKLRLVVPALAALLVTAFMVGLASNPVVVDGRAQLATSKTARSAHVADQMRTDLYDLVRFDDLLSASQEDARANVAAYIPAAKQMDAIMARYNAMGADLPDPAFAGPAAKIKSAAYWGGRAMQVKAELIDQDDAKKSADLESYRATYASEVLAAGQQLNQAATSLGIPFTLREEGPHE